MVENSGVRKGGNCCQITGREDILLGSNILKMFDKLSMIGVLIAFNIS